MHHRNITLFFVAIAGLASALPQGVAVPPAVSQPSQTSQAPPTAISATPVAIVRRQRTMQPGAIVANGTYCFNMTLPANITLPSGVALPTNGSLPSGLPERISSVFTDFIATARGAVSTAPPKAAAEASDETDAGAAEE